MFKKIREVTHLLFLSTWIILVGCIAKGRVDISLLSPNKQSLLNLNVAQVKVQNNQLIITGTNLTNVTQVKLVNSGITQIFSVESVSSTQLIANGISAVSIGVGKVFDMILSNASAAATVPVTFTLNNKSVTGIMLSNMSAQSGEVLTFNGTDWGPSSPIIPQLYKGTWDPTIPGSIPNVGTAGTGDYWIISKGGVYAGNGVTYAAGDWIIEEDGFWVKIPMSTNSVTSYNGNKGIVVTLPSDYVLLKNGSGKLPGSSLNDLANVDLTTTAPVNGNVLKYNGVAWVPGTAGGAAGAIGSTEITDLSITGADIAENTINPSKIYSSSIDAALYLRGDKTWANFAADTLNVPLSTYSLNATVKPVVGITDKIGAALGKIQKFLNDLDTDYVSKTATSQVVSGTFSFTSPTSFLYTQLPSGVSPTEVANVQYVQNYVSNAVTGGSSYAPTTLTITSSTISAASTILPVVSTTDYPPTGTLLVGSEVVSYTGKTATSFTGLTRGLYGTTASGIPDSLPVNNYLSLARSSTSVTPKMVVTGSGNVGIGTSSPSAKIHVVHSSTATTGTMAAQKSELTWSPSAAAGAAEAIGNYSTTAVTTSNSIGGAFGTVSTLNYTPSAGASTLSTYAGFFSATASGSSGGTNQLTGLDGRATFSITSTGNIGNATGVSGSATLNSNGSLGTSIGGDFQTSTTAVSASTSNAYGVRSIVSTSNGVTSTAYGISSTVARSGPGVVTTGYGLYIGSIQATTPYSIYVSSATAPSYFAGNIGIGSTAPLTKLEVTGENSTSYISNKVAGFAPTFAGYRANGTQASPTSPAVADNLVGLVGYGYVSGNYIDGGGVFVSRDSGVAAPDSINSTVRFLTANSAAGITEKMRISATGLVGIGTTPTSRLDVLDTMVTTGTKVSSKTTLNVAPSALTTGSQKATQSILNFSGANDSGILMGSESQVNFGGSAYVDALYGDGSYVNLSGSGSSAEIISGRYEVDQNGTGSIPLAIGVDTQVHIRNAGTITSAKAINAQILDTSSGAITNGYGIYVGSIQATNKWSLYASDSTAPSFFAGGVGIGTGVTVPSTALEVNGTIKATDMIYTSDRRAKHNIETLSGEESLERLNAVRPVEFVWNHSGKHDLGVIAQELLNVFPELVVHNPDDSYSVRYNSLISPMIASIQLLNKKVEKAESDKKELQKKINLLEENQKRLEEKLNHFIKIMSKNK